ncbi:uncharacterized protein LOC116187500 isoform X2 [Punica granatum]|uniref:Uncharacterized protein LOC116187500 isoform X2 n=1 Tax=Punica granatum TaxID=22663 RepID=A0A6P8BRG3_PUNGR|nr:uncharacterized protein LOC116187500 isoform X2 [Punica granatum]
MKLFLSLTGNSDETYMGYERWLPSPPKVDKPRSVYNAASLAYIGDCIYEAFLVSSAQHRQFITKFAKEYIWEQRKRSWQF